MQYLEIALPIPTHKNFFYSSEESVEVGARVKVKFGSVYKSAYVVSVFESKPKINYKVLPIIEIIDHESLIDSELMQLARDMSSYYLCSLGEALSVILPVALKSYKKKHYD